MFFKIYFQHFTSKVPIHFNTVAVVKKVIKSTVKLGRYLDLEYDNAARLAFDFWDYGPFAKYLSYNSFS